MKKILFPLAHSENAKTNFLYALDWAAQFKTSLVILHALGISDAQKSDEKDWNEIGSKCMDDMIDFVDMHCTPQYSHVKIEYVVPVGFPTESIVSAIKEEEIGLVIMGMRAHKTALGAYLSSVALDVLSRVDIPVLLIPDGHRFAPVNNMTYTFDLQFKELVVIEKLIQWCKMLEARLHCLHILEDDEDHDVMERKFSAIEDIYLSLIHISEPTRPY